MCIRDSSLSVHPRALAPIAVSLYFKPALLETNAAAFALVAAALSLKRTALALVGRPYEVLWLVFARGPQPCVFPTDAAAF